MQSKTLDSRLDKWLMPLVVIFALLNATAIYFEFFYIPLLPVALLLLWVAFYRLDVLLFSIVFFTPLSFNFEDLDIGGIGLYFPTEPLLAGVLVLFVFKLIRGKVIDRRIFAHPISQFIYIYLAWMLITSLTSTLPLVSFKFLATKMWFIAACFFLVVHLFKQPKNIQKAFLLYIIPLCFVVIYTVIRHAGYAFDKQAGHWVMTPFYKDHTSYGAVLAMYFPVLLGLLFTRGTKPLLKAFMLLLMAIITTGLVLSYTRAAWVSVAAAAVLFIFMVWRVKLHTIIVGLAVGVTLFVNVQDSLIYQLEKNKTESSDDLAEHVESISNISSDASNLERLNRWDCALQMFEQKPFWGWGPGTYQFNYAPFQKASNLTIISTNNADGGNAHSEYLGPLAEQGVIGMLLIVVLLYMVCRLGFRLFYTLKDREMRLLVIVSFLGLMTYFVHGVLNNYLDTDKASVPFWSFIAVLVAIDVFHNPGNKAEMKARIEA